MATSSHSSLHLHSTVDAQEWTREWLRIVEENPDIPLDEGTMIGWFANAIMVGYDHGYQRALESVESSIEKSCRRFLDELELERHRDGGRFARILRRMRLLHQQPQRATLGLAGPPDDQLTDKS